MVEDKAEGKKEPSERIKITETPTDIEPRKKTEPDLAWFSLLVSIGVAFVAGAPGAVEWNHWLALSMVCGGIIVFILSGFQLLKSEYKRKS